MEISCTQCGKPIAAADVNISAAVAKCRHCDSVFHIAAPQKPKAKLTEVAGVEIVSSGGETTLVRRWFTPTAYFLIFFCIAWDAFLVFWYSMTLGDANSPWIMKVFPIAHVAVGLGLTYYTLCLFMNKTYFVLGNAELKIFHKPLPWKGSGKLIPRSDIDQLYVKEKVTHSKNGTSTFYELRLKTRSGKEHLICGGMHSSEQAMKIEQEIELAFGIKDRGVSGEA
jgi:hypothetical protein